MVGLAPDEHDQSELVQFGTVITDYFGPGSLSHFVNLLCLLLVIATYLERQQFWLDGDIPSQAW